MARTNPAYARALGPNGKLLYPDVCTINVGSKNRPILVPADLVVVPAGQMRSKKMTGEMTAAMIKMAAVRPEERFKFLENGADGKSIVHMLKTDRSTLAFGLGNIEEKPMAVNCRLLPQAKLRYLSDRIIDPQLNGAWNIDRPQVQFAEPPPRPVKGEYMYGVMLVGDRPPRGNYEDLTRDFCRKLEVDALAAGVKLRVGGGIVTSTPNRAELQGHLLNMKKHGARIVLVMMVSDVYSDVKLAADPVGVETQCLKWKNIERPPRGYHINVMLKVNTKMGGTNHTLASRGAAHASGALFQKPPASISWLFDKPCM
jgi:hypothetical protein